MKKLTCEMPVPSWRSAATEQGALMKKLTCEMCGSTNLLKKEGMFVCLNCETKYSVEEAKKMMIEGTVDVSGSTVKIDNTSSVKSYYTLAENAYNANNTVEAENYCNKILEIEPENYKAWFLKGKAAGWQSTIANCRIKESMQCFTKAINCAPKDELEITKGSAAIEIYKLAIGNVRLNCNHFAKFPDSSINDMLSRINNVIEDSVQFIIATGAETKQLKIDIGSIIYNAAKETTERVFQEYENANNGRPDNFQFQRFKNTAVNSIKLLELVAQIDEGSNNTMNNISTYKCLISITDALNGARSWKQSIYQGGSLHGQIGWFRDQELSKEEINKNVYKIMTYHRKIKELDPKHKIPRRSNYLSLDETCFNICCMGILAILGIFIFTIFLIGKLNS